jgi:hypothetical protein
MKHTQEGIQSDLKQIKSNEPLWIKAGSTYELLIRSRIAAEKGVKFSESVKIKTIPESSEICFPGIGIEYVQPGMRQAMIVEKASKHIPGLTAWLGATQQDLKSKSARQDISRRMVNLLEPLLSEYRRKNDNEKPLFLLTSRLGFIAFSREALLFPDEDGFMKEMEIDVKGSVEWCGLNQIIFQLGEVKSGKAKTEAMIQLLRRNA